MDLSSTKISDSGLTTKSVRELPVREKAYEVRDSLVPNLLVRIQPTGLRNYYCTFRTKSGARNRNRVRIGDASLISLSAARDAARKTLSQVIEGRDPALEQKKSRTETLDAFLKAHYGPWVKLHRKSGGITERRIRICFNELLNRRMEDVSPWLIEKWRSARRQAGISAATINRDLVSLKSMLSKAVEWGYLPHSPLLKVKPLKVDSLPKIRFLEVSEEKRLRDALRERETLARSKRDSGNEWREERSYPVLASIHQTHFSDHLQPLVLLAMNTGLRRGELFGLEWQSVDFKNKNIRIVGESAKSSHARYLPLNDEAHLILLNWWRGKGCPELGLVFPGKSGEALNNFRKSWVTILKKAAINSFRFHDTRHHFASRLVMAGVPLNTVRELLGHADIKMTLKYAHLAPGVKADAVAKISGVQLGVTS